MSEHARRDYLKWLGGIYLLFVLFAWVAMDWWAEYFLAAWVLLFAPPWVLVLPILLFAFLAWRRKRWRMLAGYTAAAVLLLFGFARFRFNFGSAPEAAFTVITHNIGQGNRLSFERYFGGDAPDVVLLQDARGRQPAYERIYPHAQVRGVGQFLLITPHPIEAAAPVSGVQWRGSPVAARYVINYKGQSVALYNVHLPTPRRQLSGAFSPRVVLEMVRLSEAPLGEYPSYRAWLEARVKMARELAAVFAEEKLPFLVGGDFNTPDRGVVYRTFAGPLQDAHADAGLGWGYTFPNGEGRLIRYFGPWLRLDYVFAGKGWTPVDSRVGPDRKSQHRPVLARFTPSF
jgi:vancomycin resistance protein VanJ